MTIPLVFALAGQGAAIAFLISTVGVLLVALNVNQFARRSSSPGSLYTYITDHMHPRWGVLAGWALLIAYVGTAAAVSAGVTNYANVILRDRFGVQGFSIAVDRAGHGHSHAIWLIATCKFPRGSCFGCRRHRWL